MSGLPPVATELRTSPIGSFVPKAGLSRGDRRRTHPISNHIIGVGVKRVEHFTLLLSSPHGFAHRQIRIFSRMKRDHVLSPPRRLIMYPLKPEMMTADERLAEIAEILARGLVRLHARKSSPLSADRGDSFVDLPPHRSRHANALKRRMA